ncbi:MAG: chromosome segregation protein, partial [Verrucomicrobiales bacterium]|nr:chromosome segregation protein [Verrucomicrobiales bacterium]
AQELFALNGHKGPITQVDCRSDSKMVASASEDGTIKTWELQEGKQVKTWNAHTGGVLSVQFLKDGRLVSCGRDNAITLWDANGKKLKSFDFMGEMPIRVSASNEGERFFATDIAGHIGSWKTTDSKRTGEVSLFTPPPAAGTNTVSQLTSQLK